MSVVPAALASFTMRVQRYTPVGSAQDVISARDPEFLVVGPAGTGKTLSAVWKLHLAAIRHPGARILMARKTLESLKPGALNTYINGVMPQSHGVQTFGGNKFFPAEFRYPNGSVILVSGMDKADKILSAEFDMIYVNEATELAENDWQTLKTRLRNGVMPYQQLFGDCNPSGPRHWLNLRCVAGKTRRITSTHRDNPAYWDRRTNTWTEQGRVYVEDTLGSLTGIARKRLLDGVWAAAEGLVYPEFVPEMIRPVETESWRRFLTVDVGSRNPTAILTLNLRGDGAHLHVSREIYRTDMTSSDITSAIVQEAASVEPEAIFIDPSAKGYIGDLRRLGYPAMPANNDVLIGIQKVRAVIAGGFSIDPSCTHTIDEFGMYAYPDNPRIETDKPVKEFDHAMDALRYGVMGALGLRRARKPGVR